MRTAHSRTHSTCRWNCVLQRIYCIRSCGMDTHVYVVYTYSHTHARCIISRCLCLTASNSGGPQTRIAHAQTHDTTPAITTVVDAITLMGWMDWMWMCGAVVLCCTQSTTAPLIYVQAAGRTARAQFKYVRIYLIIVRSWNGAGGHWYTFGQSSSSSYHCSIDNNGPTSQLCRTDLSDCRDEEAPICPDGGRAVESKSSRDPVRVHICLVYVCAFVHDVYLLYVCTHMEHVSVLVILSSFQSTN